MKKIQRVQHVHPCNYSYDRIMRQETAKDRRMEKARKAIRFVGNVYYVLIWIALIWLLLSFVERTYCGTVSYYNFFAVLVRFCAF